MDRIDLEQRFEILEIIEKQVIFLENQELSSVFARYKAENTQWVLNTIQDVLAQMQDALDLEDFNTSWN